jgi:hypothetical protein
MDEQDRWLARHLVQAGRDAADQALLEGNVAGATSLDAQVNAMEVGIELNL